MRSTTTSRRVTSIPPRIRLLKENESLKKTLLCAGWLLLAASGVLAQGPNGSGTYYQKADGKTGAALKTALCGIIYNRTERSYGDLWTDFQTTDARPDGSVWDMYSGTSQFTFGVNQDRGAGGSNEGEYYNREHSWPNSWFGAKVQPMYTDLHHVYPADKLVNNKRSNNPFGETNGENYKSNGNFSKLGTCTYPGYTGKVFEPNDEYKGDFARTYFYMVTCYEEKIADWYVNYGVNNSNAETKDAVMATLDGKSYPGLSSWQLEMLMKWAKNDPVSEKETNRNNAVYSIQKNRNPFIDYPGLEEYIWGDKMGEPFNYANEETAIQTVMQDNQAESVYATDGRQLKAKRRGLNIVRRRSGKVEKMIQR